MTSTTFRAKQWVAVAAAAVAVGAALALASTAPARPSAGWPSCAVLAPKAQVVKWLVVPPAYQRFMGSGTTYLHDPKDSRGILKCSWTAQAVGGLSVEVGTFHAWKDALKEKTQKKAAEAFCRSSESATKVCADIARDEKKLDNDARRTVIQIAADLRHDGRVDVERGNNGDIVRLTWEPNPPASGTLVYFYDFPDRIEVKSFCFDLVRPEGRFPSCAEKAAVYAWGQVH